MSSTQTVIVCCEVGLTKCTKPGILVGTVSLGSITLLFDAVFLQLYPYILWNIR